jgi:hypothetical protein
VPEAQISPFDIIETRLLTNVPVFYDVSELAFRHNMDSSRARAAIDNNINPDDHAQHLPSMRIAYRICFDRQRQILEEQRRQELQEAIKQRTANAEDNARWQLQYSGATLLNWQVLNDKEYNATWQDGDHTYTMRINANMRVESAGICLNGTDKDYNLAAIVEVMREARRRNRPGAGGAYDNYDDEDDD